MVRGDRATSLLPTPDKREGSPPKLIAPPRSRVIPVVSLWKLLGNGVNNLLAPVARHSIFVLLHVLMLPGVAPGVAFAFADVIQFASAHGVPVFVEHSAASTENERGA